jgi:hypothetical protein
MGLKLHLLPIVFSLGFSPLGKAAPDLLTGECVSEPDKKVYLASLQADSHQRFNSIRQAIGEARLVSLKNTDSQHYYFCRILCTDSSLIQNPIWVQMSDSTSRAMDMQGFLCPMVSIENVHIVGSIWGPQPVVRKFEALTSNLFEVHQWLKSSGFLLSPSQVESRLKTARTSFQQVGLAFIKSNSEVLIAAGAQLLEISALTPKGKNLILNHVKTLNDKNWELETQYSNSDYFVQNMLRTHARYLQYSNLNFLNESAVQ